ncbi:hypothetical protein [Glycomyces paridis]|uniref:Uncharacterized protein n=1 Tax=Glycomyces paridis TaxID=2126555 RepID=A0A4S8P2H4_9ACTN|nr:hypothetical protein [Glycomyces paridis]THV21749.1 hypothetical protein E9998_24165 [Glycomyces paridis]
MRHLRRILIAITLALSATMFIPATAAQAANEWVKICFGGFVSDGEGGFYWDPCAIEVDVFLGQEIELPCRPPCGLGFDYLDPKIRWDEQYKYFERLDLGLERLSESRLTKDPDLAQKLRDESIEHFLAAAEIREGANVELNEVAWVDYETGKILEGDDQLLWAVGKDLLAGQQLMLKGLEDPKGVEAAMEAYESALAHLSG